MSLFGEIQEPGSRSNWEDWDEEGLNSSFSLEWASPAETIPNIDTLFIFEGTYLADFILKRTNVCLELWNTIPAVNLSVHRISDSLNYICLLKDYDLVKSSEVVNLLNNVLNGSKKVVSIQTKSLSEYQTSLQHSVDCIIRSILTTNSLGKTIYPKLEQPNMISGVSAGALSLREHLDLPGIAYICYIESSEDYDISNLQKLLNKYGLKQKEKPINKVTTNLYV